jgi:sporulation protein YlmC with PRC-barrel domain
VKDFRFAEIIGSAVNETEGRGLGRVFDIHVENVDGRLCIKHLLVGRRGLVARLSLGASWSLRGEEVSWERVVEARDGKVLVRPASR